MITALLVKGKITVNNTAADVNANKKVIVKNFAPFTDCVIRINNTPVDDAKYIDIVMQCITL